MNRSYFIWVIALALACAVLIFFSMWEGEETKISHEPLIPLPHSPYKSYISGVGITEASSENILIGTPLNRTVSKIFVEVGQQVEKGDVLFRLEDKDLRAELEARENLAENAQAKLRKLQALPRPEDLATAEANLKISEIELSQAKSQFDMAQGLKDPRAISLEERNRRRFNFEQAEAKRKQAEAEWNKIKAGAWAPDLEIAELEVQQADAAIKQIKAEIQRTIVRSPIDGKVLQIRIHEGELASPDPSRSPLMIVGNTDEMYLRVSINQFDAPFFQPDSSAVAFLQGDARIESPLEFVRIEPFLVNKQNLTNDISEKIDTRVLQILYRLEKSDKRIFVGQQMDVFIETDYPSR